MILSKYTEELSNIVLSLTYNSTKSLSERITDSLPLLFNFQYPIFSEDYRRILERKIIMYYYNYEIGCETPILFQLRLEEKLNRIMPLYNKMYESMLVDYDFTKSTNITRNDTGSTEIEENVNDTITSNNTKTNTGTNESNTTNTGTSENVEFDVPQVKSSGKDYASNLVDVTQNNTTDNTITIDETEHITNSNNRTATNTKTNTLNTTNTESGNNIPISELIIKYRDSLINVDNMVIEELKDLFMLIY